MLKMIMLYCTVCWMKSWVVPRRLVVIDCRFAGHAGLASRVRVQVGG